MVTISPSAEYITSFLQELMQDELRASSCFDLSIPGLPPIKKTRLSTYRIVDYSEKFRKEGRRGKTQQIPRASGLSAHQVVPGAQITTSNITRTYRNITIDTPVGIAVETNEFDDYFWNLPIREKQDLMARIGRGCIDYVHRDVFNLVTSATQATFAGSPLGGPTVVVSPDFLRKLKSNITTDNHPTNEPLYAILHTDQTDWLAISDLAGTNPGAPYNTKGDRGLQEYETGDIVRPISGIRICSSGMVVNGSVETSTWNFFIVGEGKIGAAFGHVSGFRIDKDERRVGSPSTIKYEFEFNSFLIDERAVYKFEAKKSP